MTSKLTLHFTIPLVICCWITAASAHGDPVRADFNDLVTGSLLNQFGGEGFSPTDAWLDTSTISVVTGDLVAPAGTNYAPIQSGPAQHAQGSHFEPRQITRPLSPGLDGVINFSFLLHQPDNTARGGLSFNTSGFIGYQEPRILGVGGNLFIDMPDDAADTTLWGALTPGQTALIYGVITLNINGLGDDLLEIWIDPDVTNPGPPNATINAFDAFGDQITRIGLISYHNGAGTAGGGLDLVRLHSNDARVDFNDLQAGKLTGQFGGSGFNGADNWGDTGTVNVVAGDLAPPPATNFLEFQGATPQHLQGNHFEPRQSTRMLHPTMCGQTTFSFLLNQPDASAVGGLSFNTPSTFVGNLTPRIVGVGSDLLVAMSPDGLHDVTLTNALTLGQTALIYGMITFNTGGAGEDTLEVWVNPDVENLGLPDVTISSVDAFDDYLFRVGLISYYNGTGTLGGAVDLVQFADDNLGMPCPFITEPPDAAYFLTFSDEFNAAQLDLNTWGVDPFRSNVALVNGALEMTTVQTGVDAFDEGSIYTQFFTQRYGFYISSYIIGNETGLNNAFWLNTPGFTNHGEFHQLVYENRALDIRQTIDRGEIDIQETHYPDKMTSGMHDWAPSHSWMGGGHLYTGHDLSADFNVYALEWRTDNTLRFYFNGAHWLTLSNDIVNSARSAIPLNLLFSSRVFFDGWAGPIGPNIDGTQMIVDYVRVYQKPGWTGAGDSVWDASKPGNWGADGVPGINDAAVFNQASANTSITLGADQMIRELYFDGSTTPSYTFNAGHALHLGAVSGNAAMGAVIVNTSITNPQTINCNIVAEDQLLLGNFSDEPNAVLTLNGALSAAQPGTTFNAGGFVSPVIINGPIGGNFEHFNKTKGNEVWFNATNAFTGFSSIRNGTVVLGADAALGTAGGAQDWTEVESIASIAFANGVDYTTTESIHLGGSGHAGVLAAMTVADSSACRFHGTVWLDTDSSIGAPAGASLTLSGGINDDSGVNGAALTIVGDGDVTIDADIASTINGLTKTDQGVLTLTTTTATVTPIDVQAGTLRVGTGGNLSGVTGITLSSGTTFDVAPVGPYSQPAGQNLTSSGTVRGALTVSANANLTSDGDFEDLLTIDPNAKLTIGLTATPGATVQCGGGLFLADQAELVYELGTNGDLVVLTGGSLDAATNATVTINSASSVPAGVYPLVDFGTNPTPIQSKATFTVVGATGTVEFAGPRMILEAFGGFNRFDYDNDGNVDQDDIDRFNACMAGPCVTDPPAGCPLNDFLRSDVDRDGDVDLIDFNSIP